MNLSPLRTRLRAGPFCLILLGASACDPSESLGPRSEIATPRPIEAPRIDQSNFIRSASVVDSSGPATSSTGQLLDDMGDYPFQGVYDWKSSAAVLRDFASIVSEHEYNTNYGRIESVLHVTRGDRHLLSQNAEIQQYVPAFFQLGIKRPILLENLAFLDAGCGVTARGNATHSAWWGLYQGRGAPTWGAVSRSSSAAPASGRCERTGVRSGTVHEDGGIVCSVLITYDLDTFEIVGMEVISCSTGGGAEL